MRLSQYWRSRQAGPPTPVIDAGILEKIDEISRKLDFVATQQVKGSTSQQIQVVQQTLNQLTSAQQETQMLLQSPQLLSPLFDQQYKLPATSQDDMAVDQRSQRRSSRYRSKSTAGSCGVNERENDIMLSPNMTEDFHMRLQRNLQRDDLVSIFKGSFHYLEDRVSHLMQSVQQYEKYYYCLEREIRYQLVGILGYVNEDEQASDTDAPIGDILRQIRDRIDGKLLSPDRINISNITAKSGIAPTKPLSVQQSQLTTASSNNESDMRLQELLGQVQDSDPQMKINLIRIAKQLIEQEDMNKRYQQELDVLHLEYDKMQQMVQQKESIIAQDFENRIKQKDGMLELKENEVRELYRQLENYEKEIKQQRLLLDESRAYCEKVEQLRAQSNGVVEEYKLMLEQLDMGQRELSRQLADILTCDGASAHVATDDLSAEKVVNMVREKYNKLRDDYEYTSRYAEQHKKEAQGLRQLNQQLRQQCVDSDNYGRQHASELAAYVEDLKEQLRQQRDASSEQQERVQSVTQLAQEQTGYAQQLRQQLEQFQEKVRYYKHDMQSLEAKYQAALDQGDAKQQEVESLGRQLKKQQAQVQSLQEAAQQAEQEARDSSLEAAALRREVQSRSRDVSAAQQELSERCGQLDELRSRNGRLEAQLRDKEDALIHQRDLGERLQQQLDGAQKAAMEEKRSGQQLSQYVAQLQKELHASGEKIRDLQLSGKNRQEQLENERQECQAKTEEITRLYESLNDAKADNARLKQDIQRYEEENTEQREQLAKKDRKISSMNQQFEEKLAHLGKQIDDRQKEYYQRVEAAENAAADKVRDDMQRLEEQAKQLSTDKQTIQEEKLRIENTLTSCRRELEASRREQDLAAQKLAAQEQEVKKLCEQNQRLNQQFAEQSVQKMEAENSSRQQQAELQQARSAAQSRGEQIERLELQLGSARDDLQREQREVSRLAEAHKAAQESALQHERSVKDLQSRVAEKERSIDDLQAQNAYLKTAALEEQRRLEASVASLSAELQQNQASAAQLLKEKQDAEYQLQAYRNQLVAEKKAKDALQCERAELAGLLPGESEPLAQRLSQMVQRQELDAQLISRQRQDIESRDRAIQSLTDKLAEREQHHADIEQLRQRLEYREAEAKAAQRVAEEQEVELKQNRIYQENQNILLSQQLLEINTYKKSYQQIIGDLLREQYHLLAPEAVTQLQARINSLSDRVFGLGYSINTMARQRLEAKEDYRQTLITIRQQLLDQNKIIEEKQEQIEEIIRINGQLEENCEKLQQQCERQMAQTQRPEQAAKKQLGGSSLLDQAGELQTTDLDTDAGTATVLDDLEQAHDALGDFVAKMQQSNSGEFNIQPELKLLFENKDRMIEHLQIKIETYKRNQRTFQELYQTLQGEFERAQEKIRLLNGDIMVLRQDRYDLQNKIQYLQRKVDEYGGSAGYLGRMRLQSSNLARSVAATGHTE